MSVKKKKSLNKVEEELREAAELSSKSVDFWEKEMDKVIKKIEIIELNEEEPDYEEKLMHAIDKLEGLIAKGEQEEQILEGLEKRAKEWMAQSKRK